MHFQLPPRASFTLIIPLLLTLLVPILSACLPVHPAPVLKIGLLAPFEGERRAQGYHLLPALRAATPERVQGQRVEWVILDTHGDPETAAQRTRELLADPAVLAIVGPLLPEEAAQVAPLIAEADIAWWPLAPVGEEALLAWAGTSAEGLNPTQRWEPRAWPALARGDLAGSLAPQVPTDGATALQAAIGAAPWVQDWLAWEATRLAFAALSAAPTLDRAAVRAAATPLIFPPPIFRPNAE